MIALPSMLDALPDGVVVEIKICVHANGALSVQGPIEDKQWMLKALASAMDAVRNHGRPAPIHVPAKDTGL